MSVKLGPILLIGIAGAMAWGAATVPQVYSLAALPGDAGLVANHVIFDAPLIGTRDANGLIHIGVKLPTIPPVTSFGQVGFIISSSDGSQQVALDTSTILFRVDPPAGPGPCNRGTGAIAFDAANYFYACLPNATNDGFVWMRNPNPMVSDFPAPSTVTP